MTVKAQSSTDTRQESRCCLHLGHLWDSSRSQTHSSLEVIRVLRVSLFIRISFAEIYLIHFCLIDYLQRYSSPLQRVLDDLNRKSEAEEKLRLKSVFSDSPGLLIGRKLSILRLIGRVLILVKVLLFAFVKFQSYFLFPTS